MTIYLLKILGIVALFILIFIFILILVGGIYVEEKTTTIRYRHK